MQLVKNSISSIVIMLIVTIVVTIGIEFDNDVLFVGILATAIVATLFISLGFILWGLPVHAVFERLGLRHYLAYLLAGCIPGPIFFSVYEPLRSDPTWLLPLFSGFIGAVGAIIFWRGQVHRGT